MTNSSTNFEAGKSYGNDLTVQVISRTKKTVTIDTVVWGVKRVKVRDYGNGLEYISFKSWLITSAELFNKEEATRISYERSYYS